LFSKSFSQKVLLKVLLSKFFVKYLSKFCKTFVSKSFMNCFQQKIFRLCLNLFSKIWLLFYQNLFFPKVVCKKVS
jgi:hypothetical protein